MCIKGELQVAFSPTGFICLIPSRYLSQILDCFPILDFSVFSSFYCKKQNGNQKLSFDDKENSLKSLKDSKNQSMAHKTNYHRGIIQVSHRMLPTWGISNLCPFVSPPFPNWVVDWTYM